MSFAHLHTHTAYSLLDGEGTIPKLIERAKELGQTAMAITDHGNMYGVIEFYECAKQNGIHPVLGCEVYVAARSRFDKVHEYDSISSHLILLAENDVGYQNLMKLVSAGFIDGFYYKPRIDMELLRQHSEGLIALSACMFGVLSRKLINNDYEGAKEKAQEFIDIFGRENYFIEIQDHGLYEQKKLNNDLIRLARELDLELAATNDVHYVKKSDAVYQDVLMCIQTGKTRDDEDRMKMESSELYVKSEEEMLELFDYVPEAIENTQKIALRCQVEIEFGKLHLPAFTLPSGKVSAFEYLRELCLKGLHRLYPANETACLERLEYELGVIQTMGYTDYFLIVWDFIRYARENGIMVGPGRGSAAGSLVAYCLNITAVDPMKYGLIFERFLNPERVTMPDIDIDFCYERRQEVIDYVVRKYGTDHVAQIITFGTMAAKQAIRDVGRVLNIPYSVVDGVAKQIPFALGMTIAKAMKVNSTLQTAYDGDVQVKELIDTASELEGLPRHASTHAAGVVITKNPLSSYVPLQKNDDVITTQFNMTTVERLGLLKMDFLGLRTLTVIRDAADAVKRGRNIDIDMDNIDLSDKETYAMIARGETDGLFQLESGGMKQFLRELVPTTLEDIIAGISLYRPGPMESIPTYVANKHNPSLVRYKHPSLEPILNITYGCIVYQEQVMQIVQELGGYSLGRADLLRRAMSKKKSDVMAQERRNFVHGIQNTDGKWEVEGAIRRGITEKTANEIFDEMIDFAKYAFNKSHAAAYACVAYQTAWLKCHYPTEFLAALLTSFIDHPSSVTKYINVAKRLNISVLPPDINKSTERFTVDGDNIRFGLTAVKNVGEGFVQALTYEREKRGAFESFTDFCSRMSGSKLNKRMVEALICSGAFDSMRLKRSVLLEVYEKVIEDAVQSNRSVMPGQLDLFGMIAEEAPRNIDNFSDREEFSQREILNMEKEYIGIYVSGHPLDQYREAVETQATISVLEIQENEGDRLCSGTKVQIAGMLTRVRQKLTKKGDLMVYAELEDLTGSIELLVFPSMVSKFEQLLCAETMIVVGGSLDVAEDTPTKLRVEQVTALDTERKAVKRNKLYLKLKSENDSRLQNVKMILNGTNGTIPVYIYYADSKKTVVTPQHMWVSGAKSRQAELIDLLSEENVKFV